MFIIMQRRPHTKILFASNSYSAAINFFELHRNHGNGWFELLQSNNDKPLRSGGSVKASVHDRQKEDTTPMANAMHHNTAEHHLLNQLFAHHYSPR
mgnify:CR=1 FL=1